MRSYGKGASGRRLLLWFISFALCCIVAVWGIQLWFESLYVKGLKKKHTAGFTREQVIGLALGCYALPFGVLFLIVLTGLLITKKCTSYCLKVFFLCLDVLIFAGIAAAGSYVAREVLSCGLLWCDGDRSEFGGWWGHFGLTLLLPGAILAAAMMVALGRTVANPESKVVDNDETDCWASDEEDSVSADDGTSGSTSSSDPGGPLRHSRCSTTWRRLNRRKDTCRKLSGGVLAVLILPVCFLLTTVMPNSFRSFEPAKIGKWMAENLTKAEIPDAFMKTILVKASDEVYLKIFPDTLLFYGFLELLAFGALIASFSSSLRRRLSRELVPNVSVGKACVLALFVLMLILWVTYWYHDHSYHEGKEILNTPTERIARTFGLTASLFMGLALLPASKNSLWLSALGVSCESVMGLHQALGIATMCCTLLHILCFWKRYTELGTWGHDAFVFPVLYIKGPESDDFYDNFTISIAMAVTLPALISMGLIAPLRSMHWELFKYTHYMFLVLVPVVLFHGQSAWYFMIGGVAFWLVDAGIRFARSNQQRVRLLAARAHGVEDGVIELRLSARPHLCGQFTWINVPALSTLEWHPFSIASGPHDARQQLFIKAMGEGSWTRRLFDLILERGRDLAVQLDGPYGNPPDCHTHNVLLLVAGGIGITGVLSTFRALCLCAGGSGRHKSNLGRLRHVRLVWSVRTLELFKLVLAPIAESLTLAGENSSGVQFKVKGFITGDEQGALDGLHSDVAMSSGRVQWTELYDEARHLAGDGGSVLVQACGPPGFMLAAEASVGCDQKFGRRGRRREGVVFEPKAFHF